jgi:hypothetical protein
MSKRLLPPEVMVDLQIQLDKLSDCEQRCREGLRRVGEGRMSADDYRDLVRQQTLAQQVWQEKHRKYFN